MMEHNHNYGASNSDSTRLDADAVAKHLVLVINPGSTSTKIAIYRGMVPEVELSLQHSTEELAQFKGVFDQYEWRRDIILKTLADNTFKLPRAIAKSESGINKTTIRNAASQALP